MEFNKYTTHEWRKHGIRKCFNRTTQERLKARIEFTDGTLLEISNRTLFDTVSEAMEYINKFKRKDILALERRILIIKNSKVRIEV